MARITSSVLSDLYDLLSTQEATITIKKIHGDANDVTTLVTSLEEASTAAELSTAWRRIAMVLSRTYEVSHANLKANPMLKAGLINGLINVTTASYEDLCEILQDVGKQDKADLAAIFELLFIVARFYSVNDQIPEFKMWLNRAKDFRDRANLHGTLLDAEFHDFEASEISRRLTQQNPHGTLRESIELFLQSIEMFKANGVELGGADASLRHSQNSLCVAMSKEILELIESASAIDDELMQQVLAKSLQTVELLDEIEPYFLQPGINIHELHETAYQNLDIETQVTDPKRMSNLLATFALVLLLNGAINEEVGIIFVKSLESMPESAIPQYANIKNRFANFCLAYAAVIYNANVDNPEAQESLLQLADHNYVKIANKFYAYNPEHYPAYAISYANVLVAQAVQLYVESFNSTLGNAGEKYGKEAQKCLIKIAQHPACQNNLAALDIVCAGLNAQQAAAMLPCYLKVEAVPVSSASNTIEKTNRFIMGY